MKSRLDYDTSTHPVILGLLYLGIRQKARPSDSRRPWGDKRVRDARSEDSDTVYRISLWR